MAFERLLLEDRLVVLVVAAVVQPALVVAAVLDPELGQFQIAVLIDGNGHFLLEFRPNAEEQIQLRHRLLGQGVSRDDIGLGRRTDHVAGVVGHFHGHLQEARLAGRQVIMDARLDQRPTVVDLVLVDIVAAVEAPAVVRLHQLRPRVQVAGGVLGLGRGDPGDVAVHRFSSSGSGWAARKSAVPRIIS